MEQELIKYHKDLEKLIQERTTEIVKTNKRLLFEIHERKRVEEILRDRHATDEATA